MLETHCVGMMAQWDVTADVAELATQPQEADDAVAFVYEDSGDCPGDAVVYVYDRDGCTRARFAGRSRLALLS